MAEDGKVIYGVEVDAKGAEAEAEKAGKKIGDKLGEGAEKSRDHASKFQEIWTGAARKIGEELVSLGGRALQALPNAIISGAKQAVEAYGDYEQLVGGVETLFKDSADIVMKYADNAYKTAGVSANKYMETVTGFAASLLQGLGGDTEAAAKLADVAMTDMSDNANKFGTDFQRIQDAYQGFAKQNYTMLDNLKLGYGGTATEMARLINDSGVLGDTITVTAETVNEVSFAKIVEAIHTVQTEMGVTGTTAKEASTTIQGSVNAAKAAWENLLVGVADDTQDFDQLVQNFVESVGIAAENLLPRIETALNGIAELVVALAPVILEAFPQLVEGILPGVLEAVDGIFEALLNSIDTLLPLVLDAGMQILLKLLDGLASHSDKIAQSAVNIITQLVTSILANLPTILTSGIQIVVGLATGLIKGLPQVIAAIPKIIAGIIQGIIENFPAIVESGVQLLSMLASGMLTAVPVVKTMIVDLVASIIDTFRNIDWGEIGRSIIQGIGNGLQAGWQWLIDTVENIALSLWNSAKRILGIHSPSTKFRYVGEMSTEGAIEGYENTAPKLIRTVKTLYEDVGDVAADAWQPVELGYSGASLDSLERDMSFRLTATGSTPDMTIIVPLYLDEREIARATAWNMGEQLAWLEV